MTVSVSKLSSKNRTQKGLESTRQKIAQDLPVLLATALDSYTQFVAAPCDNTAKSFSAYHTACKSALGHLDGLLRLARWAVDHQEAESDDALASLLTRARNAVADTDDTVPDDDAEDDDLS